MKNFTKSSCRVYDFPWTARRIGWEETTAQLDLNPARERIDSGVVGYIVVVQLDVEAGRGTDCSEVMCLATLPKLRPVRIV